MTSTVPDATSATLTAMVADATTVVQPASGDLAGHLALIRQLRDREAIRDLVQLYTRVVDDYDLDTLIDLFTEDGVFERRGKPVRGRAALREFYTGAMRANRTMVHIPDAHVVVLHNEHEASGWASGRAELVIDGTAVLAGFRYSDSYRCVDGRWRFARRSITFKHALPADELASGLPSTNRMRWPGAPSGTADYPEGTSTWDSFHG